MIKSQSLVHFYGKRYEKLNMDDITEAGCPGFKHLTECKVHESREHLSCVQCSVPSAWHIMGAH